MRFDLRNFYEDDQAEIVKSSIERMAKRDAIKNSKNELELVSKASDYMPPIPRYDKAEISRMAGVWKRPVGISAFAAAVYSIFP